ncbi:MAG: MmcQ/YjbR family DNA-binding protein [Oscillospiraceae bacterium]|jgi:predicted DNA-binding protein (MmcQ/YjbR family)|nr:MmcQ/YjbR family DNA-binding protein [Oscillospiraceae bacterium]
MSKSDAIEYCLSLTDVYIDYPFGSADDAGRWTVMRCRGNRKIFACVYTRAGRDYVSFKCEPLRGEFLRSVYKSLTPAYHLNKNHWSMVELSGDVPDDELKNCIRAGYELVKPKRATRKPSTAP